MVLRAALFSCPFVRSKNEENNTFFRIASIASGYRNVPSAFQGLTPMTPCYLPFYGSCTACNRLRLQVLLRQKWKVQSRMKLSTEIYNHTYG